MRAEKFELFVGSLGNGLTICNKAVSEYNDYKHIAHISVEGEIKWYVSGDYCPPEEKSKIEKYAAREKVKYETWFNGLSEMEQYEIRLSKMSIRELVDHIRKEQERKKNV